MPRPSHVRSAIEHLIASEEKHDWSVDDVLEALRDRSIPADFSSVFRGLARLAAEGVVRAVNLGDGKMRYEAVGEHHDHIRCDDCGAIAPVPGCVVEAADESVRSATGYVVTGHSLLFTGVCGRCAQEGQR
jgi:Fe2+ or Zn2+ uptake regulation protein